MGISLQVSGKDNTPGQAGHPARPGQIAEDLAACFPERHGLAVLTRNYRCRSGEVDLVCRERNVIVFVEVRLRRNTNYGGAAASITLTKQRRIILAAEHYLTNELRREADCRFDCILLDGLCDAAIEWLRDAFSAPG